MRTARTRLAVGLISLAIVALELALMRAMSLRFWHHFAYMTISVALLGFGASGTAVTLLRRWILPRANGWLCAMAMAFALSAPLGLWAVQLVPIDVQFLAWDLSQAGRILVIELLMLLPFLFAAGAVCVALMDRPERISGHYAASLIGSGVGAVAAVGAMYVLSTTEIFYAVAVVGCLAGAVVLPWRRAGPAAAGLAVAAGIDLLAWLSPSQPAISQYKMLSQALAMPDTKVIHQTEGPLGRIDVVAGPALHYAPGLSLQYTDPIPKHALMIVDGDQASAVYDCKRPQDWAFMDHTTAAAPYHLRSRPSVLVVGAGGGADIGLALYHGARGIDALEMNHQVIETMTGPLAGRGGNVYLAPQVRLVEREARGYLAATDQTFDIIQIALIDAFGASGAGLYATQESYLYTVESLRSMLDSLSSGGLLCITRWARTPPRGGLRIFDTAAQALRDKGLDPRKHMAMIRSWATVTVLVSASGFSDSDCGRIRSFCEARSFDLCYLPGLSASDANRRHVLSRPYYFEGASALLGPQRQEYLDEYLFEIAATTDDRPYFFHTFRWRSLGAMEEQLGRRSRAMLELGHLMLLAAMGQAVVLAVVMVVLPLVPGVGAIRPVRGKAAAMGYFLMIGIGFMLLEIGFLQKLILYLAHPIYSAAVVISSFLVFGGLGSYLSQRWRAEGRRVAEVAALAVVGIALVYLFGMDGWLGLTQGQPVGLRAAIAAATIAPLALAMGHMFPVALRRLGASAAPLVPWAWAINGFASVVATVAAQLIAMEVGFSFLTVVAIGCYALAGVHARWLFSPSAAQPAPLNRQAEP